MLSLVAAVTIGGTIRRGCVTVFVDSAYWGETLDIFPLKSLYKPLFLPVVSIPLS